MNLYRVIVLQQDKENLEKGIWADSMDIRGESLLFTKEETNIIEKLVAVYPARYTIITSMETKEEYDKRKSSL